MNDASASGPPPLKVLFVDDEQNVLDGFRRQFRKRFAFDTALGGEAALQLIKTSGPYAVVVADQNMPGMTGVELLNEVWKLCPDTARVMLTGNAERQTPIDAINRAQIFRFLSKPCPLDELGPVIESGLRRYELLRAERELLEGKLTGGVKSRPGDGVGHCDQGRADHSMRGPSADRDDPGTPKKLL
jgi:DNA-binding NtrC family response regulator